MSLLAGLTVTVPSCRLLLLETSNQPGFVGLAEGPRLLTQRKLESGRHHARDLAPAIAELLAEQGWTAHNLAAILVSRGPGSYTGLRVGIMSAKTLAFVTGCRLLAIDTFAVLAEQSPPECDRAEIVADAQRDSVYVQGFQRESGLWRPRAGMSVIRFPDWLLGRDPRDWVSGRGLIRYRDHLPAEVRLTPVESWLPGLDALLRLGWRRFEAEERDDPLTLEPLYLQASSAELQWRDRQAPASRSESRTGE